MDNLLVQIAHDRDQLLSRDQLRTTYRTLVATPTTVLAALTSTGEDPLLLLHPTHSTLAYVAVLNARLSTSPTSNSLLAYASTFARAFDARQLVVGPQLLIQFAELAASCATACHHPQAAIRILMLVCDKLNSTSLDGHSADGAVHLTPIHVLLLKHCLLARNYKAAHQVLLAEITDIASPVAPIRVQDFLLYHYYGGLAYIGNKDFVAALQFFEICLCTPSNAPSAIQIEAFKRHVLVSLLLNGAALPLPKSVAHTVARSCRSQAFYYTEFASAYSSLNSARALAKASLYSERFAADRTTGLVHQCLADLIRRKIRKLTDTYLTLSLSDIIKAISLGDSSVTGNADPSNEAEVHVVRMIDSNQILATISHLDGGMVYFHDPLEGLDKLSTTHSLEDQISTLFSRDAETRNLDRKIGLSRNYIQRTTQDKPHPQSIHFDDDLGKGINHGKGDWDA
ncbi:hypothetical protein BASA50_003013 [Batrachochytrium salamandrivorans]|uniref:COP9 signalosome complex subunit 3 n=1 Tax=Batrachochytrium salamandrivorans TaxID=1357716 RepID=A0ABQ8FL24_9FUNG|nr:hypothetical protein BASA62_009004 [Batrachochytrium salamandrivorans]KAH6570371.1 hypothetical protein BASA60_007760 [Batrachochytrium salamandrivorans]KAH6594499.1 hypothetical protein BASA61_003991 [Batrachochytrium salamandrivorans]KAH6599502.1 hypothetical protein BASA50_003013 [Batrachochytrium salamandrivorans]KAH9267763.1 hypothetical protein BASA84_000546 [Batrachochytrium salamandrivorans]